MGNKNYNKMSNKPKTVKEEVKVEETKIEEAVIEAVEETVAETVEVAEPKPVICVINNCEKLNIRKNPNTSAAILCVATPTSKLEIIAEVSDDWVNVVTETGVEGFCMKKYLTVK